MTGRKIGKVAKQTIHLFALLSIVLMQVNLAPSKVLCISKDNCESIETSIEDVLFIICEKIDK